MATEPFGDITSTPTNEIGQPTFVELITATKQSGQAIRTICDSTSGVEICDPGPPVNVKLRELAYGKKTVVTRSKVSSFQAVPHALPAPEAAPAKYAANKQSIITTTGISAQKAERIARQFSDTVINTDYGSLVVQDAIVQPAIYILQLGRYGYGAGGTFRFLIEGVVTPLITIQTNRPQKGNNPNYAGGQPGTTNSIYEKHLELAERIRSALASAYTAGTITVTPVQVSNGLQDAVKPTGNGRLVSFLIAFSRPPDNGFYSFGTPEGLVSKDTWSAPSIITCETGFYATPTANQEFVDLTTTLPPGSPRNTTTYVVNGKGFHEGSVIRFKFRRGDDIAAGIYNNYITHQQVGMNQTLAQLEWVLNNSPSIRTAFDPTGTGTKLINVIPQPALSGSLLASGGDPAPINMNSRIKDSWFYIQPTTVADPTLRWVPQNLPLIPQASGLAKVDVVNWFDIDLSEASAYGPETLQLTALQRGGLCENIIANGDFIDGTNNTAWMQVGSSPLPDFTNQVADFSTTDSISRSMQQNLAVEVGVLQIITFRSVSATLTGSGQVMVCEFNQAGIPINPRYVYLTAPVEPNKIFTISYLSTRPTIGIIVTGQNIILDNFACCVDAAASTSDLTCDIDVPMVACNSSQTTNCWTFTSFYTGDSVSLNGYISSNKLVISSNHQTPQYVTRQITGLIPGRNYVLQFDIDEYYESAGAVSDGLPIDQPTLKVIISGATTVTESITYDARGTRYVPNDTIGVTADEDGIINVSLFRTFTASKMVNGNIVTLAVTEPPATPQSLLSLRTNWSWSSSTWISTLNYSLCLIPEAQSLTCTTGLPEDTRDDFNDGTLQGWVGDNANNTSTHINISTVKTPIYTGDYLFACGRTSTGGAIYRMDLDGTNRQLLLATSNAILDMVQDGEGYIYYIEETINTISKYALIDGTTLAVYVHTSPITSLWIDRVREAAIFGANDGLYRVDLTGDNLVQLFDPAIIGESSVTIPGVVGSTDSGMAYFGVNLVSGNSKLRSVNIDTSTSGFSTDQTSKTITSVDLDANNNLIYWGIEDDQLVVTPLSGTATTQDPSVGIIKLDRESGTLYNITSSSIERINIGITASSDDLVQTVFTYTNAFQILRIERGAFSRNSISKIIRDLTPGSRLELTASLINLSNAIGKIRLQAVDFTTSDTASEVVWYSTSSIATLTVPPSGVIGMAVYVDAIDIGPATLSVDEILLCGGISGSRQRCASTDTEVDFQDFTSSTGGWLKGSSDHTISATNGKLVLSAPANSRNQFFIQKQFNLGTSSAQRTVTWSFELSDIVGQPADTVMRLMIQIMSLTDAGQTTNELGQYVGTPSQIEGKRYAITANIPADGTISCRAYLDYGSASVITTTPAFSATFDNSLVCQSAAATNCRGITSPRAKLRWRGTPRQPTNVFQAFVRYIVRDANNVVYYINQHPLSTSRTSNVYCDIWKQQRSDTGGAVLNGSNTMAAISTQDGDLVSVVNNTDWMWSIPLHLDQYSASFDMAVIDFPRPEAANDGRSKSQVVPCTAAENEVGYIGPCVVQAVQVFLLMNNVGEEDIVTPNACLPDPAQELDVILSYTNSQGQQKEFTQTINKSDLLAQDADTTGWDTVGGGFISSRNTFGNGVKGDTARWEAFEFNLDTITGSGLDQCTTAVSFDGQGQLSFAFKKFGFQGASFYGDPCFPEVNITTLRDGILTNEIQSITIPSPTGGTYSLTFTYDGVSSTISIPWNGDAALIRFRLATIPAIGSTSNVMVTGTGKLDDPFLVEFKGDLAGTDVDLLVANSTNLLGTGSAAFKTISNGTLNERQKIISNTSNQLPFKISFNGSESVELRWDSSLDTMQSALEGMSAIGAGNIVVTGDIATRTVPYGGPWYVDFIGAFAGQNVPSMTTTTGYAVVVEWSGGSGTNEIQELTVNAAGGTFTVTVYDGTDSATTAPIAYNATAAVLNDAIVGAASWIAASDLSVSKPDSRTWRVTYKGTLAHTDIEQATVNSSNLTGGTVLVSQIQHGSGSRERQQIEIKNASGGVFRLNVDIPGYDTQITEDIRWDATGRGLKVALEALDGLGDGSIGISGAWPLYEVFFPKMYGNIQQMESDVSDLICSAFPVQPVQGGPYPYELPKPGPGDPLPPEVLPGPIPESANVYYQTVFQRHLFDPNSKSNGGATTLKNLARNIGIDISKYTPYIRTCDNTRLIESSFSTVIETKMSFVLIENEIDSKPERARILAHLGSHRAILPSRFTWDCL